MTQAFAQNRPPPGAPEPLWSRAAVMEAVNESLDAAGIVIADDTKVVLLHDQTEESEGVRGRQCEGWPGRPRSDIPRPARELSRKVRPRESRRLS